jgi:hypothetical protein
MLICSTNFSIVILMTGLLLMSQINEARARMMIGVACGLACHLAWTWRNKEKYDDSFFRLVQQVEAVEHRIVNYGLADKIMQHDIHEQRAIIQIGWSPPILR